MKSETITPAPSVGRVVFIRAPKRLKDEELRMALSGLEESSPVWLAVNQVIDEELASAVLDSSSPTLDPSKGTYSGGKVAALGEIKARLHRYRTAPIRTPAPSPKATAQRRG